MVVFIISIQSINIFGHLKIYKAIGKVQNFRQSAVRTSVEENMDCLLSRAIKMDSARGNRCAEQLTNAQTEYFIARGREHCHRHIYIFDFEINCRSPSSFSSRCLVANWCLLDGDNWALVTTSICTQ
jgi:hypothetical protein